MRRDNWYRDDWVNRQDQWRQDDGMYQMGGYRSDTEAMHIRRLRTPSPQRSQPWPDPAAGMASMPIPALAGSTGALGPRAGTYSVSFLFYGNLIVHFEIRYCCRRRFWILPTEGANAGINAAK